MPRWSTCGFRSASLPSRSSPTATRLIEDVPGIGKTLLARAFARALGLQFARIQGTPDLLPVRRHRARACYEAGTSGSCPGPSSRTSCSSTRSTARRRGRSPRCSRRCRSARCRSKARPARCPSRSSSSRRRTRSSSRARSRCPRRSSIGSSCASHVGLSGCGAERRDRRPLPGRRRAAGRRAAGAGRRRRSSPSATASAESASATRSSRTSWGRPGDPRASGHPPGGEPARQRRALSGQPGVGLPRRPGFVLPDDVRVMAAPVLGHRLLLDVDRELRGASVEAAIGDLLASVPVSLAEAP